MAEVSRSLGGKVKWEAEHREGRCSICYAELVFDPAVEYDPDDIDAPLPPRNFCPGCVGYREGNLISVQAKRGRWFLYLFGNWDIWRVNYCEQHRRDKIPASFRRGQFNLISLLYTAYLKMGRKK